jgi:hypothetical protein
MTRVLLPFALAACTIPPDQFRDDQWCEALSDAEQQTPADPGADEAVVIDSQAVHLTLGDYSYTPIPSGRKHIVSNEPIALQVVDEDGQFATQLTIIDEHLCDDIARRWILDLEPRPYFLQLRTGNADNADSAVLLATDDEDT